MSPVRDTPIMRLHALGLGGAGGRIVDRLAADHGDEPFLDATVAFDTDAAALDALDAVPDEHRHRFGDRTGGEGLDGDLRRGLDLGAEHVDELSRALDAATPSRAEAFLIVTGLGGGTGAGVAPELVRNLRRLHDVPVYVLGVLPADPEAESFAERAGGRRADADEERTADRPLAVANAARTLDGLDGLANAIVGFDNDAWLRRDETLAEARGRLNAVAADRIAAVFGAGDAAGGGGGSVPQQVVDASDVNRALGDRSEIADIGYAEQEVETPDGGSRFGLGLFSASEPADVDTSEAVSAIETVIRKAARGKGTLGTVAGGADRTLLLVGGPPAWLNREAIAEGRRWLAEETGSDAILSGDAPDPDAEAVHAVVLRAGVDPTKRLREILATSEN